MAQKDVLGESSPKSEVQVYKSTSLQNNEHLLRACTKIFEDVFTEYGVIPGLNRDLSHKYITSQFFLSGTGVIALGLALQNCELIGAGLFFSTIDSQLASLLTHWDIVNFFVKDVYLFGSDTVESVLGIRDSIRGSLYSFVEHVGSYFDEDETEQAQEVTIEKKNN